VEIEGFDTTACGGTHVARTGEIGLLKIIKLEKRGDKTRLEFRCGGRALADYGDKHQVISALATEMNCRFPEVPEIVTKLRAELKTAQTALKELREQLVEYEAVKLLAEAPRSNGCALITASFDGRDAGELKLLASRLTENENVVVLIGTAGEKAQLIFARSADLAFNMGALLKEAVGKLGGRGGGQPAFAQGGGVTATLEQIKSVIEAAAANL
jgi:alanyl-tRNA synthetase